MAIQNLQKEFEALGVVLKKSLAREAAIRESNDMTWTFSKMKKGLMAHYFGSKSKGTNTSVIGTRKGAEAVVNEYVPEVIDALYSQFLTDPERRFLIEGYNKGKFLHVFCLSHNQYWIGTKLQGTSTAPYNALRDESGIVYNKIVEGNAKYKTLFWGDASAFLSRKKGDGGLDARTWSMSTALHAGHKIGVSENLAHAVLPVSQGLEADLDKIEMSPTDPAFEDFQQLKGTLKQKNIELGKIVLKVKHNRPKFDEGKFSSGTILFETDHLSLWVEGGRLNMGKELESEAGNLVRTLKNDMNKDIAAFFKKHPESIWTREGSKSIRDKVRDSFASPRLRKMAKKKVIKAYKRPGGAVNTPLKPIVITPITLKTKSSEGSPMGDTKGKGKRGFAQKATQEGPNLASLQALLNAKLPQTVAKNMGPPGLVNQTGRFASSVRVTDVSQTAKGHPSIGYNYQRNPYQVFEMTHGDPRWATPDRDPRKLIDASIREIAAQKAIGRFYTRRV